VKGAARSLASAAALAASVGLAIVTLASGAHAKPTPTDAAREDVKSALREGKYTFCTKPRRPMTPRQAALCPLADEIDGCKGFADACEVAPPKEEREWLRKLAELLAPAARILLWLVVGLVVLGAAVPVLGALLRYRRDRRLKDRVKEATNVASPAHEAKVAPEALTDAEAALRAAEEHAQRGELDRALSLYLSAALAALDRRGAIRIARHRTNGEYVRACSEEPARAPLREIVREVDRVEYGKLPATPEAVTRVGSRAAALVRHALLTTVALLALLTTGCGVLGGGPDDPAGDDLPREVLRRNGFTVSPLESSLSTMPMPKEDAPIVVVDLSRVALEDETVTHLLEWVDAGGHLVLLGDPGEWPQALAAKRDLATTRDLDVGHGFVTGARVAKADAVVWSTATPRASLGDRVYAASLVRGAGLVLGVANADLFTNIGVARPDNAAALVALVRVAAGHRRHAIAVARAEDGVPPPSNPFTALARAGLAKGAWHALAATLLLFLAVGVRQARPRPAAAPARRAFAEHVEATGAFYRRTKAHAIALVAYGRFAEMRLRERIPRGMDPATFLATRAGVPHAEAARVWTRATSAKRDDEPRGDEIATIRELRGLLAKAL
jgi:hypothetical protein